LKRLSGDCGDLVRRKGAKEVVGWMYVFSDFLCENEFSSGFLKISWDCETFKEG
jgi:hypothetical protein